MRLNYKIVDRTYESRLGIDEDSEYRWVYRFAHSLTNPSNVTDLKTQQTIALPHTLGEAAFLNVDGPELVTTWINFAFNAAWFDPHYLGVSTHKSKQPKIEPDPSTRSIEKVSSINPLYSGFGVFGMRLFTFFHGDAGIAETENTILATEKFIEERGLAARLIEEFNKLSDAQIQHFQRPHQYPHV